MSNLLSFSSKIASRGYHVYMNTTWQNAFVGERVWVQIENNLTSKQIDPYCCAVKISSGGSLVTVGHVPREISRFVYFFIRDEGGNVEGTLLSTRYRLSPIPAGGLEVPLKSNFSCQKFVTFEKMKTFIALYDYDCNPSNKNKDDSSDLEDEMEDEINIDIVVESGETKSEGDDDDQKYDNEHGSGDNDDDEQDNDDEENEEENDSSESDIGNNNSKPKKRRYIIIDDDE